MMNLKQRTSSKESLVQCGGGRVVAWLCICSAKVTRRSIEIQSNAQPERHFLNYKGQGTAGYWWAITKHVNPVNKRMCLNGEVGLNTFHYLRQKVSKTNRTWKHLKPNVKILKFFLGFFLGFFGQFPWASAVVDARGFTADYWCCLSLCIKSFFTLWKHNKVGGKWQKSVIFNGKWPVFI